MNFNSSEKKRPLNIPPGLINFPSYFIESNPIYSFKGALTVTSMKPKKASIGKSLVEGRVQIK